MAALFLFVLASPALWWWVTCCGEPCGRRGDRVRPAVTGYSQGWLLAMAATLGFVVAVLLVASWGDQGAPGAPPPAPPAAAGATPASRRAGGAVHQRAGPVVRPR